MTEPPTPSNTTLGASEEPKKVVIPAMLVGMGLFIALCIFFLIMKCWCSTSDNKTKILAMINEELENVDAESKEGISIRRF